MQYPLVNVGLLQQFFVQFEKNRESVAKSSRLQQREAAQILGQFGQQGVFTQIRTERRFVGNHSEVVGVVRVGCSERSRCRNQQQVGEM